MALEVGSPEEQLAPVQVALSELLELNFAIFLLECHEMRPGHQPPHWIPAFQREHPGLYERVRAFWGERSGPEQPWMGADYFAWDEMLLAATHTGTLRDERIDRFFERLPQALSQKIAVPPLATETPEVVRIVGARLERLRESASLRESYVELLRDLWAALEPAWRKTGRAADLQAIRGMRPPGTIDDLRRLLPGCSMLRKEAYEGIIREGLERREVLIVPLWFAGDGQCLTSLPGTLLVGVGAESGRKMERKREQAERVAARLKVLSDPTRVSMLIQMMHQPFTITDLANYFELSQPTVSVHMKALREAGLVIAEKKGNQTNYRVDGAEVSRYVMGALEEMGISPEV